MKPKLKRKHFKWEMAYNKAMMKMVTHFTRKYCKELAMRSIDYAWDKPSLYKDPDEPLWETKSAQQIVDDLTNLRNNDMPNMAYCELGADTIKRYGLNKEIK